MMKRVGQVVLLLQIVISLNEIHFRSCNPTSEFLVTLTVEIKSARIPTVEINDDILEADALSSQAKREFRPGSQAASGPRPTSAKRFPSVRLNQGQLTGTVLKSRGGRNYRAFYTIPYGAPPVGELRFKPPQPAGNWTGTRNATVMGPMCVQKERYNPNVNIVGSEDCLYVHIFTPEIPRSLQKVGYPVIAYFFGGGFMQGTANDFGGDYFLDEDVVIVLVESRIGAFGFLNTGDFEARGNQGLKDQILALQWIQTNIGKFGGDPLKVNAMGSSSGAIGAHLHLFSPLSAGLVSGIMSLSGTAFLSTNSIDPNPRQKAIDLGKLIGCRNLTDSANLIKCLKNVTAEEIAMHQFGLAFMPSVEAIPSDGNINQTFMAANPYDLLQSGEYNQVPWLTGVNSAEAIAESKRLLRDPIAVSNLNSNWDSYIPEILNFRDTSTNDIAQKIRQFYFGHEPVSNATRSNLTNMLSDRMWIHPAKTSALLQAQRNTSVFMYYLTKEAKVSSSPYDTDPHFEPPYGVCHGDDLQYLFVIPRFPYIPIDSEWGNLSKVFVHAIVTFANISAPVGPTEWPRVDPKGMGTVLFNLDDETKLVEPVNDRMELWDSFPMDVLYNHAESRENVLVPNVVPNDYRKFTPSDRNKPGISRMDYTTGPSTRPVHE